jgi:hypothetical protein
LRASTPAPTPPSPSSSRAATGAIDVGGLTTTTPLKALAFKQTRLTGTVTVGGTLRTLTLGDVSNANITVGGRRPTGSP